jgi:hypothetical protein
MLEENKKNIRVDPAEELAERLAEIIVEQLEEEQEENNIKK